MNGYSNNDHNDASSSAAPPSNNNQVSAAAGSFYPIPIRRSQPITGQSSRNVNYYPTNYEQGRPFHGYPTHAHGNPNHANAMPVASHPYASSGYATNAGWGSNSMPGIRNLQQYPVVSSWNPANVNSPDRSDIPSETTAGVIPFENTQWHSNPILREFPAPMHLDSSSRGLRFSSSLPLSPTVAPGPPYPTSSVPYEWHDHHNLPRKIKPSVESIDDDENDVVLFPMACHFWYSLKRLCLLGSSS